MEKLGNCLLVSGVCRVCLQRKPCYAVQYLTPKGENSDKKSYYVCVEHVGATGGKKNLQLKIT